MAKEKQILRDFCKRYMEEEPSKHLQAEIMQLLDDEEASLDLCDRMERHLTFGTAGLRGKMEAGYNRMNVVSVYRLSYALGLEVQKSSTATKSVVIGFDGRDNSKIFAEEASRVLRAMGITVHKFTDMVHTPLCAYATKYLKANAGIMVTASHNPPMDNGIKLFDGMSAQAHGQMLKNIEEAMRNAPLRSESVAQTMNDLHNAPLHEIGDEVVSHYFSDINATRFFPNDETNRDIKVAYTPLHGVGKKFFLQALKQEGYTNIVTVPEQAEPNGKFPTVEFPNPEEANTLDLVHSLAITNDCEVVIANDPDADRLQISCPDENGAMKKLSGNEMGAILGYFALMRAQELHKKPLLVSSIVSSRMLKAMCVDMGARYMDALTGFSNIVQTALRGEKQYHEQFIFGYEEAIGFLIDQVVLDKDGIHAAARFMEVMSFLRRENRSIWQLLDELYLRFGIFVNTSWSWRIDGSDWLKKMEQRMVFVRTIDPLRVAQLFDQSECKKFDLLEQQKNNCYEGLRSNVVIFEIGHRGRLIVRPSGTEPKIKFYLELFDHATDQEMLSNKRSILSEKIVPLKSHIERLFGDEGA